MGHVETALAVLACVASAGCARPTVDADTPPRPPAGYLASAHSHNDYQRARPLMDALERGFASIEVDVVLRSGELYVAHEEGEVDPAVTLTGLYLDPLRAVVRRNGGWIYAPSGPSLQLLIDVKSEADRTYQALDRVLGAYPDVFTAWTSDGPRRGPVTAVISGHRALRTIKEDTLRYVAIDGRLGDERSVWPVADMPLVSVDWDDLGPSASRARIGTARELVAALKGEGRKIRFWGTLDDETLWRSLIEIGVDYIGTDDAARLERLLVAQQ